MTLFNFVKLWQCITEKINSKNIYRAQRQKNWIWTSVIGKIDCYFCWELYVQLTANYDTVLPSEDIVLVSME